MGIYWSNRILKLCNDPARSGHNQPLCHFFANHAAWHSAENKCKKRENFNISWIFKHDFQSLWKLLDLFKSSEDFKIIGNVWGALATKNTSILIPKWEHWPTCCSLAFFHKCSRLPFFVWWYLAPWGSISDLILPSFWEPSTSGYDCRQFLWFDSSKRSLFAGLPVDEFSWWFVCKLLWSLAAFKLSESSL